MLSKRTQKFIIVPILILILLGPIFAPFAESFNFPERYDLVAILVEQGLYGDTSDYDGLVGVASGPITRTTIKQRVDRYAIDLQNALPGTRALVIQVDRFEKPENIAAVLEKLYFEGDPREPNRIAYLKGIVIIGETPLPVVNKQGNRFISLFPYTDFEQKAYVWNPQTQDFELSPENENPQPEIWHGVIRPPVSTQVLDGKRLISAYFDKNHLFHVGDPSYANFNKKVFFQDFAEEKRNLNPIAYRNYLKFLEHIGDIAYFRYTKTLFQDLSGPVLQEMSQMQAQNQSMAQELSNMTINGQPIPMDSTIPQPTLPSTAPTPGTSSATNADQIPDIMTKIGRMSDNFMARFNEIFTTYPNLINDFVKYTGRYTTQTPGRFTVDADTAVNLITAKDAYTMGYLKAINTMIENKIDEIVNSLQKPVPLVTETNIEVTQITHKQRQEPIRFFDNQSRRFYDIPANTFYNVPVSISTGSHTPAYFTNFSPELKLSVPPPTSSLIPVTYIEPGAEVNPTYPLLQPSEPVMLGTPFSQVNSVSQCTLYRGSKNPGSGRYSKAVEANHAFNPKSADEADNTTRTGSSTERGLQICDRANSHSLADPPPHRDNCLGFTLHAGCFYVTPGMTPAYNYDNPNQRWCFPERAVMPISDSAGTRAISAPQPGYDDYRNCFNFHEKDQWQEHLNAAELLLRALDHDSPNTDDMDGVTYEERWTPNKQAYRTPDIQNTTKHPDSIMLFENNDSNDRFQIRLGDVFRVLGMDPSTPDFQNRLNLFLATNGTTSVVNVSALNPLIQSVGIRVNRDFTRTISSVFQHKEPTNETINAQARNMLSLDLPVDQPRYVTFQTYADQVGRVTYPDLFAEPSLDAYLNRLREIENQLNAFRRLNPASPLPCQNCLANLLLPLPEISRNPTPGGDTIVTRANREKVLDALNWKNMDIDSKHKYLTEYYLDSTKNAYIGESLNGYELVYLNGEGFSGAYNFSLVPQEEETDPVFQQAGTSTPEPSEPPYDDDPDNPFDDPVSPPAQDRSYDIFSWSMNPISPWWERMQEWAASLRAFFTTISLGRPASQVQAEMDEEIRREREEIERQNREIERNPANADQVNLSRIDRIELQADSGTAAIEKRGEFRIFLRDSQGNIVNDEFAKITLVLEQTVGASGTSTEMDLGSSSARFSSDVEDENLGLPGHQITILSGSKTIGLIFPGQPGRVKVIAQIDGTNKRAERDFDVVRDARLTMQTQTLGVIANGSNSAEINISAVDASGNVINNVNGVVRVAVSDPLMGRIQERETRLTNGRGVFHLIAGRKKGLLAINATSDTLNPGRLEINMLPGPPARIGVSSDSEFMPMIPGGRVSLSATLFDANNNAVDTNSSAQIDFRITANTQNFGTLSSPNQRVSNGVANVYLMPRQQSGDVNIVAQSAGLLPGAITIKATKQFGQQEVSRMRPDALAVSLLGIPAGNVVDSNYLAGWFLMNGRTQVGNSLTSQPIAYQKLIDINSNGGIALPDTNRISLRYTPANNFTLTIRDNQLQTDLGKMTIFTLEQGRFDVTEISNPDSLADGIYIKKLSADEAYSVDRTRGALRLAKNDSNKVEIQTNGYVNIFDNNFSLRPRDGKFLTVQVLDREEPVAEIYFVQHFNQDINIQESVLNAPGVYLQPFRTPPEIFYERTWAGNSSTDPRGAAFFDKETSVSGGSAPGFASRSLEDSRTIFGVGFTEDNKFALLFSGGETFGEANKPYASDIGIVFGDPTVKIDNRGTGQFSKDMGKLVYAGGEDINGILNLDYNGDGYEDILAVEGDEKIRLIQNNGGYDQLKDQGYIMNIKNGIADLTKADYNNDGRMDLIIAGRVSCRRGDTCVDVYENQQGAFVRHNLHFNDSENIVRVRGQDLNNDGYPELVFANASGDIKVLYNRNGQFDQNAQTVGNVGLQINPSENLISSVIVRYNGMPAKNSSDPMSAQRYETLSITEPNPAIASDINNFFAGSDSRTTVASPIHSVDRDFIYADLDTGGFAGSTKTAQDLNGGILRRDDRVKYTITLQNNSGIGRENVMISDVLAEQLELDRASARCLNCGQNEMTIEELTGEPTRPLLFKFQRIANGASRHIVYEAVFKADAESTEAINIMFNNNFQDSNPSLQSALRRDSFPDLAVTKEGNPTGQLRYFYTTGLDSNRNLQWATTLSTPSPPMTRSQLQTITGLEFPQASDFRNYTVECTLPPIDNLSCLARGGEPRFPLIGPCKVDNVTTAQCQAENGQVGDPTGPPPQVERRLQTMQENDRDSDSLQDVVDDIDGALENAADATQAAISRATCNAGCIPLPVNAAFLSPGFFSVLGSPGPFDIGLPVFGWGAPSLIPTYPPMPPLSTLGGRFYISPSLTGGVGFAVCLGPFGTPLNCFSFGINPLDLIAPGVCDSIAGSMNDALSSVNSAISRVNEGMTVSLGRGGASAGSGRREGGSGMTTASLGSYSPPISRSRNVRIPGFLSIITEWASRQWEEVMKVMALPDFYLIYPDPASIVSSAMPTGRFQRKGNILNNILSWVNSIPLVEIETTPVTFKIPTLTKQEIEKFKQDARQWWEDERQEIDKIADVWKCFQRPVEGRQFNVERCRFLSVEVEPFLRSVMRLTTLLDEWLLFPKKIAQYRAIEAYYLSQIIDYVDTIIQWSGGWVKKNIARIKQWRRAIRQIRDVLKSWKLLFRLMIDYNATCDRCKTERWSLKDLILKIFIAIPSPPIIPLPKLPDFVIDVSKLQGGLKIKWPDVQFKPERITLPKIPRIPLGVNIPVFRLKLPDFDVNLPSPPNLPALPALPPLPLPRLPDFPPAPTMPGLPGPLTAILNFLRQILRILCMIRMGFLPVNELLLKTRIEEITARGLAPLLPIDLLLTVQTPTISITYVDKIVITAFTSLQLDLSYIQQAVEAAARLSNSKIAEWVKFLNKNMAKGSSIVEQAIKEGQDFLLEQTRLNELQQSGRTLNYLDENALLKMDKEELTKVLTREFGMDATQLVDLGMKLKQSMKDLEKEGEERKKLIAQMPKTLTLEIGSENFMPKNISAEDLASGRIAFSPPSPEYSDEDLILPFQKQLKAYRDNMAAYVNETQKMLSDPNFGENLNELSRYIASQKSPFIDSSFKRFITAADFGNTDASFDSSQKGLVKIGEFDLESIDWLPEDNEPTPEAKLAKSWEEELNADMENNPELKRLLAYGLTDPPEIPLPPGMPRETSGVGDIPPPQNVGLFFIDTSGQSQRLIEYTNEVESESFLADIDIDNDNDTDKLYSYGKNLYLKRNNRMAAPQRQPVFRPADIEFWTIFELLPKGTSPNFPKTITETSREASFSFNKPAMNGIVGFDIVAKHSPYFFERANPTETIRANLLLDSAAVNLAGISSEQAVSPDILMREPDGEVFINENVPSEYVARSGDYIRTGGNGSVTLAASDGTTIRVSQNTGFTLTQGGPIELDSGNLEINIPENGSMFFPAGSAFRANAGQIRLRFFDGSEIRVSSQDAFNLPEFTPVYASVKTVSGDASFIGSKRDYVRSNTGRIRLAPGEIIHPLSVVRLKWKAGAPDEKELSLSRDIMMTAPGQAQDGIDIQVENGMVEIIRSEQNTQPVSAGMALMFGDKINNRTGSLVVNYKRGGDTVVNPNEKYMLGRIESLENPVANLELDPAFYFAKIRAFDAEGNRSTSSEKLLLAPQVCGDGSPPVANVGGTEFTIAVSRILELNASASFDSDGRVISYWLDTDSAVDSDGDGNPNNDKDLWRDLDPVSDSDQDGNSANDADSPVFSIGPFSQVGQKLMRLTVRDEALNEGYRDITVNVITPRIVLEPFPLRENIISGYVEPPEANVPITIARLRPGTSSSGWEIFRTPSADSGGQYYTDADGRFRITDADLRDRLVVRNSNHEVVAEINTQTGRVSVTDPRYEARLIPSAFPNLPMRIGIFLRTDPPNAGPLTFVYFVPDVNTDVVIDGANVEYNENNLREMSGTHVKPLPRSGEFGLSFRILSGGDPQTPGAAVLERQRARKALIDVNGDIVTSDSAIMIRVKDAAGTTTIVNGSSTQIINGNDPVVFEMLYNREPVAEIFIAAHLGPTGRVQIVDEPRLPSRPPPRPSQPFSDISSGDSFSSIVENLYRRGIVAGYGDPRGELEFRPDNPINRAEFTQITLKMLCIVPREEATRLPSPFYDVLNERLWFYPVLKEGNIRGFIRGYVGETRRDAQTGISQTPFKPASNITWAEAATVVLAALQEENVIDLSRVNLVPDPGAQWYQKYIQVAQNLQPYLKNPSSGSRAFLITAQEAARATEPISRRDFAIMADRVLLMYDCHDPRLNPDNDPDRDRLLNSQELQYGTDPFNADTDGGGVSDYDEVQHRTNPADNPDDDYPRPAPSRNEEGIFVLRPACNSCPCRATLGPGADLQAGDILFAAITGRGGLPIHAKSNEETY